MDHKSNIEKLDHLGSYVYKNGCTVYGEVIRVHDVYLTFEIPLYDGDPLFMKSFSVRFGLDDLLIFMSNLA